MKYSKLKVLKSLIFYQLSLFLSLNSHATPKDICRSKNIFSEYSDIYIKKCHQDRSGAVCKNLENKIKSNGADPEKKLKQCHLKAAQKELAYDFIPFVSTISCAHGVIDFGIDSFVQVGEMIGEFAGAVKVDWDTSKARSEKCNSSLENKLKLYLAYNISTPKMMNIKIPTTDSIAKKKCWQIENELRTFSRYEQRKLENKLLPKYAKGELKYMTKDEKDFWQWSHPGQSDGSGHTELLKLAKELIQQKGLELDCYSSYTAQALICEAVTAAATLLLGPKTGLKNIKRSDQLLEIAGLQKKSKRIFEPVEMYQIKSAKLSEFPYKYDIDYEPIMLDGQEYLRVIPNKHGHWLARQAEVYKRRYNSDFIISDPKNLSPGSLAENLVLQSEKENFNFLVISTDINLNNVNSSMAVISHELVHIRNQSTAFGATSLNSDPPITIYSAENKIPLEGYSDFSSIDEVEAYGKTAQVMKKSYLDALRKGDEVKANSFNKKYLEASEKAKEHEVYGRDRLKNAQTIIMNQEKPAIIPEKIYGTVRATVTTYDNKGNKIPLVFEFPANTPTDPTQFNKILLDRIQRELDKNRKIINGL